MSILDVPRIIAKQTILPWSFALPVSAVLVYVLLCRALRFRRRDGLLKRFHYPTRESLAKMTNDEAQAITQVLGQLEFPYIYTLSLQFALFKTYGIPSISKILVETKQFSSRENAGKRYADTAVIVDEIAGNPPTSERCIKSLARLNFLHGQYPQIRNADFLYTLAQFIVCPVQFIDAYEWRSLSLTEICAIATLWKGVGDGMNITYEELRRSKEGWRDGLEFYEDIKDWAEEYEKRFMVPAETNRKTGDETSALLLWLVPGVLHPYVKHFLSVIMGERVRISMMYPRPPEIYYTLVTLIFAARRRLLLHLSLPRPHFLRVATLSDAPDPRTQRYHYQTYQALPYYVAPTFYNRWVAPQAWVAWLLGGAIPGQRNGGDDFERDGYVIEDVGPKRARGKGKAKMAAFEETLRRERLAGCPFAGKGC